MPSKECPGQMNPITFCVGSSTYQLSPDCGFQLMRWSIKTAGGEREILYWPENPDNSDSAVMGGNPLLFPFCGRSFDRGKEGAWRSPAGKQLPVPIHGFARNCRFEVTGQSDSHVSGELVPSVAALESYPFAYRFAACYQFEELCFTVTLSLANHGGEPIPWSAGHHFFFTVPWHRGARRADYLLRMDPRKCAYHGPDGRLVTEKDRESCHDLSDTKLLDRIHWELRHNRVSFGPKGGEEDVHIVIGDDPVPQKNYSVVTWSESESAPYYCIEPWMGPPNAAEHGKGLHWVRPGETESFKVEVSLY